LLDEGGAMVACEDLVDRRVGAELEHRRPMEGVTVEGEGPYVVWNAFVEPLSRQATSYVCTVERIEGGWRLVDIATHR
jgi:hypothetical protein